ncbi:MAG: hypothetical protein IBJ00_01660 [Alphaproteobacteria bacterium]|nr:hypothetical protein [Alphaproteobacteria bacterium]
MKVFNLKARLFLSILNLCMVSNYVLYASADIVEENEKPSLSSPVAQPTQTSTHNSDKEKERKRKRKEKINGSPLSQGPSEQRPSKKTTNPLKVKDDSIIASTSSITPLLEKEAELEPSYVSPDTPIFALEVLLLIFDADLTLLPKASCLNHELYKWAQPKLRMFGALKNAVYYDGTSKSQQLEKDIFDKNFASLIFSKYLWGKEVEVNKRLRFYLKEFVKGCEIKSLEIYIDNQNEILPLPSLSLATRFRWVELVEIWHKLNVYKNIVSQYNRLWETYKISRIFVETLDQGPFAYNESYKRLHEKHYKPVLSGNFISYPYEEARGEMCQIAGFLQWPRAPLIRELTYSLIELDKLALAASGKAEEFYDNYPDLQTMKAYQQVSVDLSQNSPEVRLNKLQFIKEKIIEGGNQHLSYVEKYIKELKHYLMLG